MKKHPFLTLLAGIALAEGVGLLSALFTGEIGSVYRALRLPPFSPPGWVFPVAWSLLYALMGIAAGLVFLNNGDRRAREQALLYFGVQLAVNFSWTIIFFRFQSFWPAVTVILVLDILVCVTLRHFFRVSKPAGWLLVPYLLWLLFATYLAVGVFILN